MSEVFFQHKLKKQGQDTIDAIMQIGIKFLEPLSISGFIQSQKNWLAS